MLRPALTRSCCLLLGFVIVSQVGCAGKNLLNWKQKEVPHADQRNPVRKIVCVWEPVQGQGLDNLPTRGFAGQIMFFTNKSPAPATSDGVVQVLLYHDRGTKEQQARPIHKFEFQSDAWSTHLSESVPGPSYRVFIPYTDKHSWQVNCALRVSLTPPNGAAVYSELVHVRLPGPMEEKKEETAVTKSLPELQKPAPGVSDYELGAVVNRRTGTAAEVFAENKVKARKSLIERAMHVHMNDEMTGEVTNAVIDERTPPGRFQLTAREEQAIRALHETSHARLNTHPFADSSAPDLTARREATGERRHPLSSETDVEVDAPPRRFRLAPTTETATDNYDDASSPLRRATDHPLDGQIQRPHPLDGF